MGQPKRGPLKNRADSNAESDGGRCHGCLRSIWQAARGTHAVCLLAIAAPALIGRALDRRGEMILRGSLAALAVCYWLAYTTWWNWHGLEPRTGLPLQVCDVNGLIAPLALMSGWRYVRATLYFWTAALTLQAFIQPALTAGPASLVFWAFWVAHSLIAACAVYDIVVLGYRAGAISAAP